MPRVISSPGQSRAWGCLPMSAAAVSMRQNRAVIKSCAPQESSAEGRSVAITSMTCLRVGVTNPAVKVMDVLTTSTNGWKPVCKTLLILECADLEVFDTKIASTVWKPVSRASPPGGRKRRA